ncbi:TPA: hypothetical protein ACH3X1_015231 [Trebouxia sp. C0004]
MVFHCWLEERQLVREAKYLLQALEILAVSIEKHSAKHQQSVPGKLRTHWEQHKSRLLSKAVEKLHASPEGQDEGPSSQGCPKPVAPFDLCRLHQLFSGASLMARSASLLQRAELQHMQATCTLRAGSMRGQCCTISRGFC